MQSCCMLNLKTKKMINWKRFGIAILCAAVLIGGSMGLARFFPNVLLALVAVSLVCSLTLAFYMLLGDILDKDKNGTDKD